MDHPPSGHLSPSTRPAADPVVGWRYWHLRLAPVWLSSVTQRAFVWAPGEPIHARCVGEAHVAPDAGCACGVYANGSLDGLRAHGLCLPPGGLVIGEVALWGTVLAEQGSYRGEYGYPRRLSIVEGTVSRHALNETAESLSAAYAVPVDTITMADAVGEVSAAIAAFLDLSR